MKQQDNMPYPGINMFMGNMPSQEMPSPINLPEDLRKLLEENSDDESNCSQCYPSFTESQKAAMRSVQENIERAKKQQMEQMEQMEQMDFHRYADEKYPSTEMEMEERNDNIGVNKPKKSDPFLNKSTKNNNSNDNNNGFWKFNEDKTLKDAEEYIKSTYHQHYTSEESKVQVLDIIEAIGDGVPFCRDNLIKYSARFGKKNGFSKLDALKIIHYGILLYNFAGFHKNTTDRYETF